LRDLGFVLHSVSEKYTDERLVFYIRTINIAAIS